MHIQENIVILWWQYRCVHVCIIVIVCPYDRVFVCVCVCVCDCVFVYICMYTFLCMHEFAYV